MVSDRSVGRMCYAWGNNIVVVTFLLRCSAILIERLRILLSSSGCFLSGSLIESRMLHRLKTISDSYSVCFAEFLVRHLNLLQILLLHLRLIVWNL